MCLHPRGAERLRGLGKSRVHILYRSDERQCRDRHGHMEKTCHHQRLEIGPAVGVDAKYFKERSHNADRAEGQLDGVNSHQRTHKHKHDQAAKQQVAEGRGPRAGHMVGDRKADQDRECGPDQAKPVGLEEVAGIDGRGELEVVAERQGRALDRSNSARREGAQALLDDESERHRQECDEQQQNRGKTEGGEAWRHDSSSAPR